MGLQPFREGLDAVFGATKHESVETDELNTVIYADPADDGAGIQAAIDAVNPGGTVELLGGTYTVSSPINLDDVSDVTIRSDHDAVVTAADGLNSQIFNNVNNNPVENVTFEGFEIDGTAANQDLANATNYYSIGTLEGSDHIVIRDMTFRNVANNALVFNDGDNHRIANSRFYDTGHPDATKTAAHVVINGGSGHVIANNEFGRATDNAVFARNDGTVIYGNRFNEVFVYAMDSGSHNLWFVANEIVGTPTNPVDGSVQGGRFFRLEQDNITNIHIKNNTLHGLTASYPNFIQATSSTTGLENIHIEGNLIHGGGHLTNAININDAITNVTINRNYVEGTQRHGISLNGLVNGSVSCNTVYNTNTSGDDFTRALGINRANTTTTAHLTVKGNVVIDDRSTTLHYNGLRVDADAASWLTISDNVVSGATAAERDVDTAITNLVYNGLGYNSGVPGDTGQWTGEGFEGLTVRDTTNADTYLYNNGTWSQITSA